MRYPKSFEVEILKDGKHKNQQSEGICKVKGETNQHTG